MVCTFSSLGIGPKRKSNETWQLEMNGIKNTNTIMCVIIHPYPGT